MTYCNMTFHKTSFSFVKPTYIQWYTVSMHCTPTPSSFLISSFSGLAILPKVIGGIAYTILHALEYAGSLNLCSGWHSAWPRTSSLLLL